MELECAVGRLEGSDHLFCSVGGLIFSSGETPHCVTSCDISSLHLTPLSLVNGVPLNDEDTIDVGVSIKVSCVSGSVLDGGAEHFSIGCDNQANWEGVPPQKCIKMVRTKQHSIFRLKCVSNRLRDLL